MNQLPAQDFHIALPEAGNADSPLNGVIADLDQDHEAISRMLADKPRCLLAGTDGQDQLPEMCPYRAVCKTAIRRLLNTLIRSSVAHFGREFDVLRSTVCRDDFTRHGEEHIRFTEILTDILARFTETGDCRSALLETEAFAHRLREHMASVDVAMLHTRPPAD